MAENKKPMRISELAPAENFRPPIYKPDEIKDKDVVFLSVEHQTGNYGGYVLVTVADLDTGEEIVISSGAKAVVAQIEYLEVNNLLPAIGKFVQSGRSWIIL